METNMHKPISPANLQAQSTQSSSKGKRRKIILTINLTKEITITDDDDVQLEITKVKNQYQDISADCKVNVEYTEITEKIPETQVENNIEIPIIPKEIRQIDTKKIFFNPENLKKLIDYTNNHASHVENK